jgi:hypothetical protein
MLLCVTKMGFKCRQWIALAMILLPGMATAAPVLAIITTNGVPGTTIQVPVMLATDTNVLSAEFDLRFNAKSLAVSPPVAGEAISDHVVASCEVKRGVLRVQVTSFSNAELKDGVLVYVPMTILENAPLGKEDLAFTNAVLFKAGKIAIRPMNVVNGVVMISKPVHFNTTGTNEANHGEAHGVSAE